MDVRLESCPKNCAKAGRAARYAGVIFPALADRSSDERGRRLWRKWAAWATAAENVCTPISTKRCPFRPVGRVGVGDEAHEVVKRSCMSETVNFDPWDGVPCEPIPVPALGGRCLLGAPAQVI
jgi:hypothetical protein